MLKHFTSWREAVRATGLSPFLSNIKLENSVLLKVWGQLVRKLRQKPTISQWRREGKHSPSVFMRRFGPWSEMPGRFREFAQDKPEWADVLALLPATASKRTAAAASRTASGSPTEATSPVATARQRHRKLEGRPIYGNPIDFRGLRQEPVNEQGVVFVFGMLAEELGFKVDLIQVGFPDCLAVRKVKGGGWQPVRIEFKFESRSFRDDGQPADGCDVIVCWCHNWPDCPAHLEVVELASVIKSLAKSED